MVDRPNMGGQKVSGQNLSTTIDKTIKTGHIIDVGWFDTHFFFIAGGFMALHENNYFTDHEWFAIDEALCAILNDLSESALPDFSVSFEKAALAYDLDQCQKEELIRQYDWHRETLTHYPER